MSLDIRNNTHFFCEQCNMNIRINNNHCCKCQNKWNDKSQIHCDKCFKHGVVAFSCDGTNITYIISKYNGEGIIYNLKGQIIFSGNFKSGKYDNDGILYFPDGKTKFKGFFFQGFYNGYGTLYDENCNMTCGFFLDSKLYAEFKKINYIENNEDKNVSCNLCTEDF